MFFVIGIILIVKGGDWFVDSASWIAHAFKIPTFVVGATIVSFATTLPELTFSLLASINGKNDLAVGNAIGTIIANTGLVMSVGIIFISIFTPRKNYWQQCSLLICSSLVLWIGCIGKTLNIWFSLILLCIFIIFIILNLIQGKKATTEDNLLIENANNTSQTKPIIINNNPKQILVKILFFVLGAVSIILGSHLLITHGTTIATKLGIPEHIIAITLISIGTSLPELMTTITAVRKKEGSLSIGNIIGANIINLTLILPTCSLITSQSFFIPMQTLIVDFPFCLIISIIAVTPMLIKQRTYRWQGILMLLTYIAYLITSLLI